MSGIGTNEDAKLGRRKESNLHWLMLLCHVMCHGLLEGMAEDEDSGSWAHGL